MEETLKKTIRNELSVVVIKEPLAKRIYKEQNLLQENYDEEQCIAENTKLNNKKQVPLLTIFESHNLPYKECNVILERLDLSVLKQKLDAKYTNEVTTVNTNILPISSISATVITETSGDEINLEKLPVYKQINKDGSNRNNDLYEFNEPDFENMENVSGKLNKKRKVKGSKHLLQANKKKRKPNKDIVKKSKMYTYDAAVREILQKIMKKVNKNKENENAIPIQKEPLHVHNTNTIIQLQSNLSDVEDTNDHDDHHEAEVDILVDENKASENDAQNNSGIVCYFYSPLKAKKKIHIISDITLDNTENTFFDINLEPDANSTVLIDRKCYPWRFNEHFKRNPHYLSIKKTALPCLQQDLIIDYIQVKKIEEHFAKVSKKFENCVNKSVLLGDSELYDVSNKENIPHSGLFDADNFFGQTKSLQDNLLNRQKRNILGPRLQNEDNIMSQKNMSKTNTNTVDIRTLFNQQLLQSSNVEKSNENLSTSSQNPLKESVNNNFDPKLFEDEEEPNINFDENSKIYIPKIRKKKLYDNLEESNQDKYKKEMKTVEDAKLEQWAAKFNSLCRDIEKYKLEIE